MFNNYCGKEMRLPHTSNIVEIVKRMSLNRLQLYFVTKQKYLFAVQTIAIDVTVGSVAGNSRIEGSMADAAFEASFVPSPSCKIQFWL